MISLREAAVKRGVATRLPESVKLDTSRRGDTKRAIRLHPTKREKTLSSIRQVVLTSPYVLFG